MSIVREHRGLVAGAVSAGAALTIGVGGVGYAATGGNFILGQANSASTTSSLHNPYGTALSLTSNAGTPALRVSNAVKVGNLNADLLDGLNSTAFAKAGSVVRVSAPTHTPSEGPINRQARAYCATGEHAVGGGADVRALTEDRLGEYFTFERGSTACRAARGPGPGLAVGWKGEAPTTASRGSGHRGRGAQRFGYVICAPA